MRIIKIKNCKECPYFTTEMDQNEKTFGKLLLICLEKSEGYKTYINFKSNINCLEYETNKDIDKLMNDLDFDIPGWCPLEELKKR